jgi:hypothetical protein
MGGGRFRAGWRGLFVLVEKRRGVDRDKVVSLDILLIKTLSCNDLMNFICGCAHGFRMLGGAGLY